MMKVEFLSITFIVIVNVFFIFFNKKGTAIRFSLFLKNVIQFLFLKPVNSHSGNASRSPSISINTDGAATGSSSCFSFPSRSGPVRNQRYKAQKYKNLCYNTPFRQWALLSIKKVPVENHHEQAW